MAVLKAIPFGFRYLENQNPFSVTRPLELRYDESLHCTLVKQYGRWKPFILATSSCGHTQTVTENTEAPEDDEEEHESLAFSVVLTVTATKTWPEDNDDDDDDKFYGVW